MFNIIRDTREKYPWEFDSKYIGEVIARKLDTGDYTVEHLEGLVCIERKRTVQEIALNLRESRFIDELNRMKEYKYRFLVCEFDLDDVRKYPIGSNIPKKHLHKIRINGEYILKCLSRFQVKYGVNIIFAGDVDNAIWSITNIMREIVNAEGD